MNISFVARGLQKNTLEFPAKLLKYSLISKEMKNMTTRFIKPKIRSNDMYLLHQQLGKLFFLVFLQ